MAIYQGLILEHFRRPRNRAPLAHAEAIGDAVNPLCGDVLQLFLTIDAGRITAATFVADACAVCIASASLLTESLRGKLVSDAIQLTADDVFGMIVTPLPAGRHQCATLPLIAMGRALGGSVATRRAPATQGTGLMAIVLAAGAASRFGGGKLTASIRGEPIIRRSVRAVTGAVDRVIVVVGPESGVIREALDQIDVAFAINEHPSRGMSSSIRAGIVAVAEAAAAGVLIVLGDQPLISPDVPRALTTAWRSTHSAIVVPRYDGVEGHPVLFDRLTFLELQALSGDSGARSVIERDPTRVAYVDLARELPRDVDTTDDLATLGSAANLRAEVTPQAPRPSPDLDSGPGVSDG